MGVDEFRNILSIVFPLQQMDSSAGLNNERMKIVRTFDALGHCEFDYKHRKVYVCPPTFVGLPTYGLPRALLTGARSPMLLENIRKAVVEKGKQARIIRIDQEDPLIPLAVIIESSSTEIMAEIAKIANLAYEPNVAAWEMINFAAEINEMKSPLENKKDLNWPQRVFSNKLLRFVGKQENKEGTRLVEYRNPINKQYIHWLWEGAVASKVDRDWGRYMSLSSNGINVLLQDKIRNHLYVPEYVPLPTYYARALTLCSGLSPWRTVVNGQEFNLPDRLPMHVYSEVPPQIADLLGQKLSQVPRQIKAKKR